MASNMHCPFYLTRSAHLLLAVVSAMLFTACGPTGGLSGERVIGEKLQDISPPDRDTGAMRRLVLFDPTIRMIHQFDLENRTYERSLSVVEPELEHHLLYQDDGSYIIDLADRRLATYDQAGRRSEVGLNFVGAPVSAAFRPRLGFLVIYTDVNSVGLIKFGDHGQVLKSAICGPVISTAEDLTIVAGDLNDSGDLVVALSDDRLAVLDVENSITSQSWSLKRLITTAFHQITWVAPVRGKPQEVLIKHQTGFALLDLSASGSGQTLADYEIARGEEVALLSKAIDAHFLIGDATGSALKIGYIAADTIHFRSLNESVSAVTSSRLNLATDSWALLESDEKLGKRLTKSFRFHDLVALFKQDLPPKGPLQLLENSVFALLPSELGHAIDFNLSDGTTTQFQRFNVGHLDQVVPHQAAQPGVISIR
jgi:hypothetical protein